MLIPLWVALIVTLTAAAYSVTWDLLVAEVEDLEPRLEGPERRDEGVAERAETAIKALLPAVQRLRPRLAAAGAVPRCARARRSWFRRRVHERSS